MKPTWNNRLAPDIQAEQDRVFVQSANHDFVKAGKLPAGPERDELRYDAVLPAKKKGEEVDEDFEALLRNQNLKEDLLKFIDFFGGLSPIEKQILKLRLDGKSFKEIGESLGKTEGKIWDFYKKMILKIKFSDEFKKRFRNY